MNDSLNAFAMLADQVYAKGLHGILIRRHGKEKKYYTISLLENYYTVPSIENCDWYTEPFIAVEEMLTKLSAMPDKR